MKKNDNTTATEKPAKKLTAEQKAKAKEKLAKKRAALKEKKRLAREKKAARLAKKRAAKKAVREAKKAKKLARIEKKRARILKARELKRARLEKKRARLAAKKAKIKELKAKGKLAKKVEVKPAKVAVEKADLKNVPTKDMAKELTKRLKTFAKVLADRKNDAAEREELEKRIAKDGIQVGILDGVLVARLFICAEARVTGPAPQIAKCSAIEPEQPKENAQPEAAAREPAVEAEATEVPIGDTYGSEPTDEELAQIEAEQDAEAADGDEAEDDEEEEEIDPRSDVDDEQADFRREFFGASENTEDFE